MPRPSQSLVGFIALVTLIITSFATAQTPASSASPETAQTDATVEQSAAPAQTPAPSPHRTTKAPVSSTTRAKTKPAPVATPVHAGFGSMMPGVHTQASPSPTRERKPKKNVAEKAASPAPKKNTAAAAPVKQATTPASPNAVASAQSAASTHVTPPPVRQTAPLGDQAEVRSSQPTVTTGEIVVPAAPEPPAEGPVNVPVKQHPPAVVATAPPADQPPAPVVAATAAPAVTPPPVPQTATKTQANSGAQVWVNTETHVYHRQGARYYGKTRKGKYMSEQEALAEGDRPAREWVPTNSPRQ